MSRLIFVLVLLFPCVAFGKTIHKTGPSGDRMDLVLLAEGYTANQEALFNKHALSILNTMKTHKPFDRYLALMNVHTGFRASAANGLRDRSKTNYQTYRVGGTVIRAVNSARILIDAQNFAPEADRILVICNEKRKGGTAYGTWGFVTTHGWFEFTAIHELGHMMSGLADEYVNTQRAYQLTRHLDNRPGNIVDHVKAFIKSKLANRMNVSPYGTRHMVPWKLWIKPETPVPGMRDTAGVSAFEGAYYFSRHVWKPRRSCTMNIGESEPFCEVCREQLVVAIYKKSRPVTLTRTRRGGDLVFTVSSVIKDVQVTWNGSKGAKTLEIPAGTAWDTLTVRVTDRTPWVRKSKEKDAITKVFTVRNPDARTNQPSTDRWVDALVGQPEAPERPRWTPSTPPSTPARTTPTSPARPDQPAWPRSARVIGVRSSLNVRLGPSTRTQVVGSLGPNASVTVTGTPMAGWTPVKLASGTRGFVASKYLKISSVGMTGALGERR